MKQYIVTLNYGNRTKKIRVIAANEDDAKLKVMKSENCPESDIIKVRKAMYNRIN